MTMRFPLFSLGGHSESPSQAQTTKKEPLPIEIQLGSNAVKLTRDGWRLDSRELSNAQEDCHRLEQEVLELRRDLEACRQDSRASAEQANMSKFQNELLLDMLAVARVDEGAFKAQLGQEAARQEELARSLEQAYTKIIGAGLDPGVSDAP